MVGVFVRWVGSSDCADPQLPDDEVLDDIEKSLALSTLFHLGGEHLGM